MSKPRLLAINLGNTTVFAGLFVGRRLVRSFRVPTASAHQPAAWRGVGRCERVVLCSVVPARTAAIGRVVARRTAAVLEILTPASPHGLEIAYRQPSRLGADRVAAALGARARYPGRNVIVVDCGTATTVTALHRDGRILGGAILPGAGLWSAALAAHTAQLPAVALERPARALGRTPEDALHSGIFHGHAGAIREVVARVRSEAFGSAPVVIVGTGGHAPLFRREQLFTVGRPDLILTGLHAFASSRPFQDA